MSEAWRVLGIVAAVLIGAIAFVAVVVVLTSLSMGRRATPLRVIGLVLSAVTLVVGGGLSAYQLGTIAARESRSIPEVEPAETPPTPELESGDPGASRYPPLWAYDGDCFIDDAYDGNDERSPDMELEFASCSYQHNYEVLVRIYLGEGDYPGDEAVLERSRRECRAEMPGWARKAQAAGDIALVVYHSFEGDWSTGSRTTICALTPADGHLFEGYLEDQLGR